MCGIAGIYRRGQRPPTDAERAADRELVANMLMAIEYRGPDDQGLESIGRATLGVRRLSILDVAGGHQPLSDVDGRIWAMQNGEIYNFPSLRADLASRHPMRTQSDTEVLPYLYLEHGQDCPAALRGMFAIAVYDTRDESLLLARDPLGVKPLYVAEVGERLLFASEMKALLCDPDLPRDLDLEAVGRYLALGYVPGTATVMRAIRKVRPGCRVRIDPKRRSDDRYWRWPRFFAGEHNGASIEDLAELARRKIQDSTTAMLLSDRPLGVLLSGGIDSGVMVALLPEAIRRETKTFTIGFENYGLYDERRYAREVAEHLGTRHKEFTVTLDVAEELPRVVAFMDEPCSDPANVPAHLVARRAAEDVTVLLSGTGGDEVFGGYTRHRLGPLLQGARWIPRPIAALGARALADRHRHRGTQLGEGLLMARKLLLARSRSSFFEAYLSADEPTTPARWAEALAVEADPTRVGQALWAELLDETGAAPVDDQAIAFTADHLYGLPDRLLLKEDRTTMGASVEGRVPYLDADLVGMAAGMPSNSRFEGKRGKRLLRMLARQLLPAEIANRPKHGFNAPYEDWLRGPLDALAGDAFAGPGSGVFHSATLKRWHDQNRRGVDRSGPLWSALHFELWWRSIGSATPRDLVAAGHPMRVARA